MITINKNIFQLDTANTSYIIALRENNYPENIYFGKKIKMRQDYSAFYEKIGSGYGNSIATPQNQALTLDNLCLEFSFNGCGDYRIQPLEIVLPDGSTSARFEYKEFRTYQGIYNHSEETAMPYARAIKACTKSDLEIGEEAGGDTGRETLELVFVDDFFGLELSLIYTSFDECDCITRRTVIKNNGEKPVTLEKIMSLQLDLPEKDYFLDTFDGMWTRERHKNTKELISGVYVNESTTGSSSNRHNPFIMLHKPGCDDNQGDCIGINLIYSGNHYEAVEVTGYEKLRILSGINPFGFSWELGASETFYSPEAVLSYSTNGENRLSNNFHKFIQTHIIHPDWQNKERPVLINNWEATYFDFNESKLIKLAKDSKELGIELFVLDDGWFGKRSDDTSSLGDWQVNEKKIGGSLSKLVDKINDIGMQFGIWVEPEMISENSALYEAHPDWAVKIPGRTAYLGRNQLVLDYTREDVRDYIVEVLSSLLESATITYVKWDMNRHITDAYSQMLKRQGEFYHRYILGLYAVMEELTNRFPKVLFESCSSGGNRFDLGMLFYMPQTWTSDDTDANERITIQEGTSYAYPQATMGAHVSAVPNHQTLRNVNLESRFQVACFGLLGYELDITKLNPSEKKIIKKQIEFYKQYRSLFQFGTFSRGRMHNGNTVWQVVSKDQSQAAVLVYQQLSRPNQSSDILKITGLKEDALYEIKTRKQAISIKQFGNLVNQVSPVPISDGGLLQAAVDKVYHLDSEEETYHIGGDMAATGGIKLKQQFTGVGYNENTRIMGDFSSRIYIINEILENDME